MLQIHCKQLATSRWEETVPLFSVWCSIGMLSMSKGSRMSQSLILIDALSSASWEKRERERERERERKRKTLWRLFPRARHTLLAVLRRIFAVVSAIKV
jgi:hypothetical protein